MDYKPHPNTKKLQHTTEIPSVELTLVSRGASWGVRGDQESKGTNWLWSKWPRIELTINRESKQYGSALYNQWNGSALYNPWKLPLLGLSEPVKFAVTKPCHIPQCSFNFTQHFFFFFFFFFFFCTLQIIIFIVTKYNIVSINIY